MNELLLAVGVVIGLLVIAAAAVVPWGTSVVASVAICAVGFGLGLPAALVYHVRLWQALRRHGPVPRRWIWDPIAHHERLDALDRDRVLPWFFAGGAAFVVVCLGIVWIVVALVAAFMQA